MRIALIFTCWFGGFLILAVMSRRIMARRRSRARVFEPETTGSAAAMEFEPGFLTRWLGLAGYRAPGAAAAFVLWTAVMTALGAAAAVAVLHSGLTGQSLAWVRSIPGGAGELFIPVIYAGPWILFSLLAFAPWLVVRSARRRRVRQVEQDLPTFLELIATLSESGIGFDAALDRILGAQPTTRQLTTELRTFQSEVLAGRGRIDCLRRLARRLDVISFSIFISAVVQAEQIGAGLANVLRRQADDARDRRRERALQLAMALPVKLLFPLIACFLPGIFVWTFGPTFSQFFRYADTVIPQVRQLQTPFEIPAAPAPATTP